jgi:hypothetical protein
MRQLTALALLLLACASPATIRAQAPGAPGPPAGQSDLDAFMAGVLARRDDNWTKLQQYILDERERVEIRGPGRTPIWGAVKDYTWYIRDGFFVRSPLRADGVAIGEADRRKYEEDFLRRELARETRRREREARDARSAPDTAESQDTAGLPEPPDAAPSDAQGLLRQSREPLFISSAYFLRFKFEPGRYALVGRETVAGREVLRIEYYPTRLFSERENRREQPRSRPAGGQPDDERQDELRRVMNKVSLVTLWVEPDRHQIVKYTFENVGLDFLPSTWTWLLRVADVEASMVMSEAFPDVWLPERVDVGAAMILAPGRFDLSYGVAYTDYREAAVTSTIRPGGGR